MNHFRIGSKEAFSGHEKRFFRDTKPVPANEGLGLRLAAKKATRHRDSARRAGGQTSPRDPKIVAAAAAVSATTEPQGTSGQSPTAGNLDASPTGAPSREAPAPSASASLPTEPVSHARADVPGEMPASTPPLTTPFQGLSASFDPSVAPSRLRSFVDLGGKHVETGGQIHFSDGPHPRVAHPCVLSSCYIDDLQECLALSSPLPASMVSGSTPFAFDILSPGSYILSKDAALLSEVLTAALAGVMTNESLDFSASPAPLSAEEESMAESDSELHTLSLCPASPVPPVAGAPGPKAAPSSRPLLPPVLDVSATPSPEPVADSSSVTPRPAARPDHSPVITDSTTRSMANTQASASPALFDQRAPLGSATTAGEAPSTPKTPSARPSSSAGTPAVASSPSIASRASSTARRTRTRSRKHPAEAAAVSPPQQADILRGLLAPSRTKTAGTPVAGAGASTAAPASTAATTAPPTMATVQPQPVPAMLPQQQQQQQQQQPSIVETPFQRMAPFLQRPADDHHLRRVVGGDVLLPHSTPRLNAPGMGYGGGSMTPGFQPLPSLAQQQLNSSPQLSAPLAIPPQHQHSLGGGTLAGTPQLFYLSNGQMVPVASSALGGMALPSLQQQQQQQQQQLLQMQLQMPLQQPRFVPELQQPQFQQFPQLQHPLQPMHPMQQQQQPMQYQQPMQLPIMGSVFEPAPPPPPPPPPTADMDSCKRIILSLMKNYGADLVLRGLASVCWVTSNVGSSAEQPSQPLRWNQMFIDHHLPTLGTPSSDELRDYLQRWGALAVVLEQLLILAPSPRRVGEGAQHPSDQSFVRVAVDKMFAFTLLSSLEAEILPSRQPPGPGPADCSTPRSGASSSS
ncbi:hypothetical protein H696_00162 [Fonticula alba]|uniref:Uncharacterized protein n=1 Tax=Fonticula alba TaxID=691883 RepID=A0A058ZF39_FONAL|nr:hypothetical protein H696_00162 [Fonticula alba]KCV72571.1 hypothetical protein H696_00162 [Fonticula alba]|eukprot:XP_009492272.1 hypothetical protein H696_00162 [Fonticula alba]